MVKGTLKRWNDEQGFGFIRTDAVGEDVFIHVSALKGLSRRPLVGDTLVFDLEADDKGRKRAVNARIEGMKSVFTAREIEKPLVKLQRKPSANERFNSRQKSYVNHRNGGLNGLIGLVFLIGVLFVGYKVYSKTAFNTSGPTVIEEGFDQGEVRSLQQVVSQFQCEGKTRCSQMTSCEEAMFYLNHCPGSVTDGDGDGRPCEDQWCGH
jgi:cold shock CspA family protein